MTEFDYDITFEAVCKWNRERGLTDFNLTHEHHMLEEEVDELFKADTKENVAKELADIIFVAIGSLCKLTGDPGVAQAIMDEVIEANQAKGTTKVKGKVVKGEKYVNPEPFIRDLLDKGNALWK